MKAFICKNDDTGAYHIELISEDDAESRELAEVWNNSDRMTVGSAEWRDEAEKDG